MSGKQKTLLRTKKFDVIEHVLQTGQNQPPVRRQVVEHPGAVAMIPLLEGDRVCLIRNQRLAVGKTLVELPAGTIDPNEDPQQTATRELQEETGYTAARWRQLSTFYSSPGILSERMYLFVAEELTAGSPAREPGEQIQNLIVPWDEAVRMAEQGEIEDAKSLVGILLWDRLRSRENSE